MARDNLEEAVELRSNDPRAQLYLGKVISLTARTPEDRQAAEDHFMKAIQYDGARGAYPDPHLEHALHLIGENGDKGEIKNEIEAYVALYQREHMGALPNNMAHPLRLPDPGGRHQLVRCAGGGGLDQERGCDPHQLIGRPRPR